MQSDSRKTELLYQITRTHKHTHTSIHTHTRGYIYIYTGRKPTLVCDWNKNLKSSHYTVIEIPLLQPALGQRPPKAVAKEFL